MQADDSARRDWSGCRRRTQVPVDAASERPGRRGQILPGLTRAVCGRSVHSSSAFGRHWTGCSVASVRCEEPAVWRDLELGAPRLARLGMARLDATRVALLGTLRRDGSPRISPIEPYLADSQLLIGAMAWSQKTADLRRDPRYVLHSAVTGPDSGEGELKLYGSAAEAAEELRLAAAEAWWSSWAADRAIVFALHIDQAVFVSWDTGQGVMTVERWSPRGGYRQNSRTYP